MKLFATLFSFLSLAYFGRAICPNKCSGHGSCSEGDVCQCEPRWIDPDCGSRECPFGVSWVSSADTSTAPSGTSRVILEGTLTADASQPNVSCIATGNLEYADACSAGPRNSSQGMCPVRHCKWTPTLDTDSYDGSGRCENDDWWNDPNGGNGMYAYGCYQFDTEEDCLAICDRAVKIELETAHMAELSEDFKGYEIRFLSVRPEVGLATGDPSSKSQGAEVTSGGIWGPPHEIIGVTHELPNGNACNPGDANCTIAGLLIEQDFSGDDAYGSGFSGVSDSFHQGQKVFAGDKYRIRTGGNSYPGERGIYNLPGAPVSKTTRRGIQTPPTGRHHYTECSSKGICDRTSGECVCFEGYEGSGCKRQACPSDCSGHGRCVENNKVNPFYGPTAAQPNEHVSQYWDYNKTRQCLCDRGWSGYDCADRLCPRGSDPLSECGSTQHNDVNDIQLLSFQKVLQPGYITLSFVDKATNGNYTTVPIYLYARGHDAADSDQEWTKENSPLYNSEPYYIAAKIEEALENLPNFVMPNVTVTPVRGHDGCSYNGGTNQCSGADPCNDFNGDQASCEAFGYTKGGDVFSGVDQQWYDAYYVTFVDAANAGRQNLLECSLLSAEGSNSIYNTPAHQPRFVEAQGEFQQPACRAAHQAHEIFNSRHGYDGFVEKTSHVCSNRGNCDVGTGLCQCFEGFSGEACSDQTVFF